MNSAPFLTRLVARYLIRRGQLPFLFAAMLLVACMVGCAEQSSRLGVSGEVTFKGAPIKEGKIGFMPLPGTSSPTAGATIRDGKFEVSRDKGLKPGEFEVTIKAVRSTGKQVYDEISGGNIELKESYLPARYNSQTELRAIVKGGEKNHLTFDLTDN